MAQVESAVVLTTKPNELVAPLHERMPVIIPGLEQPGALRRWLGLQAFEFASGWDPAGWHASDPRRLTGPSSRP